MINVIPGFDPIEQPLPIMPNIDKVAFPGSTEVSKIIMQAAPGSGSSNLKRASLELGGICCADLRTFAQSGIYDTGSLNNLAGLKAIISSPALFINLVSQLRCSEQSL